MTEPSVSTAGSFRTKAFLATILRAPKASEIVTTAGRASGMAATARLTAVRNMSSGGSPRTRPTAKTMMQIARTATARRWPNRARRRCKGVFTSPASCSSVAILPNSVCMPVATATPAPRPYVTIVPL